MILQREEKFAWRGRNWCIWAWASNAFISIKSDKFLVRLWLLITLHLIVTPSLSFKYTCILLLHNLKKKEMIYLMMCGLRTSYLLILISTNEDHHFLCSLPRCDPVDYNWNNCLQQNWNMVTEAEGKRKIISYNSYLYFLMSRTRI